MKKILLAVCAFAVVSLVGCKKDNGEPDPQQDATTGEGIYNPGAHIATASTDGETQHWYWEGSKLDRIETTDVEGVTQGVQQFTYNGNRIASVTQEVEGVATETRVTYSGNYISAITLLTDGHQSANATVSHNSANKIDRVDLDVDASYVTTLLGDLIGNMGMKNASKFTLNNADIYGTLEWQGDNVSRMIVHADIDAGITMEEISQVVDLSQFLGELASLLSMIQGEQAVTISLVDTIDYTYDQHPNPLQGMIGMLDPSVLSANNPTIMDNHGSADVTLTLNVPFVGQYPIARTVPINRITDIVYTYNNAGYPLTVSPYEGGTTTYTYND